MSSSDSCKKEKVVSHNYPPVSVHMIIKKVFKMYKSWQVPWPTDDMPQSMQPIVGMSQPDDHTGCSMHPTSPPI